MSRQIQLRRGSADEHTNFVGANGEVTVDTTNKTLRVHDGETVGGVAMARATDIAGDWVVESQLPTAENNYTWYRKYKSGWVEMGGYTKTGTGTLQTIIFPVKMSNNLYTIVTTNLSSDTNNATRRNIGISAVNTENFSLHVAVNDVRYWHVCGVGA